FFCLLDGVFTHSHLKEAVQNCLFAAAICGVAAFIYGLPLAVPLGAAIGRAIAPLRARFPSPRDAGLLSAGLGALAANLATCLARLGFATAPDSTRDIGLFHTDWIFPSALLTGLVCGWYIAFW